MPSHAASKSPFFWIFFFLFWFVWHWWHRNYKASVMCLLLCLIYNQSRWWKIVIISFLSHLSPWTFTHTSNPCCNQLKNSCIKNILTRAWPNGPGFYHELFFFIKIFCVGDALMLRPAWHLLACQLLRQNWAPWPRHATTRRDGRRDSLTQWGVLGSHCI